jgi:hypothetical protein
MRIGRSLSLVNKNSLLRSFIAGMFALLTFMMASSQSSLAFPAFARKYGLPCSACHEAWPKLNVFGQTFKDNGYQLMNDRDSPIWQNPSYWPVTFRITPNWHRESVNRVAVDTAAGANAGETRITSHGFDLSGLDILSGGTIYNNISFLLVPSVDSVEESIGIESAWGRFDNLAKSPWLNIKMGKFEFDNIISEKRGMTLSSNGGGYQLYHFVPVGDTNVFAQIGDNQLGFEWMGHSINDRTRASIAVVSSNDGTPGLQAGNAYSTFITASQAFNAGYGGGVDRVGAYVYAGKAATLFRTQDGGITPILGSGIGNKGFHREGLFALLYAKKLDFQLYYQHGWDNAYFGAGLPANTALPVGSRSPTWNGGFIETHWVQNPQFILIQRSEWVRMSQQAIAGTRSDLGDLDAYTFGWRWYPIMFSRAGFALHNEYAIVKQVGTAPDGFNNLTSSSLMFGFDFDF